MSHGNILEFDIRFTVVVSEQDYIKNLTIDIVSHEYPPIQVRLQAWGYEIASHHILAPRQKNP